MTSFNEFRRRLVEEPVAQPPADSNNEKKAKEEKELKELPAGSMSQQSVDRIFGRLANRSQQKAQQYMTPKQSLEVSAPQQGGGAQGGGFNYSADFNTSRQWMRDVLAGKSEVAPELKKQVTALATQYDSIKDKKGESAQMQKAALQKQIQALQQQSRGGDEAPQQADQQSDQAAQEPAAQQDQEVAPDQEQPQEPEAKDLLSQMDPEQFERVGVMAADALELAKGGANSFLNADEQKALQSNLYRINLLAKQEPKNEKERKAFSKAFEAQLANVLSSYGKVNDKRRADYEKFYSVAPEMRKDGADSRPFKDVFATPEFTAKVPSGPTDIVPSGRGGDIDADGDSNIAKGVSPSVGSETNTALASDQAVSTLANYARRTRQDRLDKEAEDQEAEGIRLDKERRAEFQRTMGSRNAAAYLAQRQKNDPEVKAIRVRDDQLKGARQELARLEREKHELLKRIKELRQRFKKKGLKKVQKDVIRQQLAQLDRELIRILEDEEKLVKRVQNLSGTLS